MPKEHSYTDEQIREAATILTNCGIFLHVSGCFDLETPDDAVRFAQNSGKFYGDIKKNNQDTILDTIQGDARELGVSIDDYLYYIKYSNPSLYEETGASDVDLYGGRCATLTSKGKQCRNFVQFKGTFQEFKKGISDKCTFHRKKNKK